MSESVSTEEMPLSSTLCALTINDDERVEDVLYAMKTLARTLGGEHKLFEYLSDDSGIVTEANLRPHLQTEQGVVGSQTLRWLDTDGDGQVSEEDFNVSVVQRLYAEQVVSATRSCGEATLDAVAREMFAMKRGKPALECIADMSDSELEACATGAAHALSAALKAQRDVIKEAQRRNDGVSTAKLCFGAFGSGLGQELMFENLGVLEEGLESLIGAPAQGSHAIRLAMEREHASTERFTTANYGVDTFDRQEYDLVDKKGAVDYEFDSARQGRDVDALREGCRELQSLTREEVVALVLYTGPMSERYNLVLQSVLLPMVQRLQVGEPTPVTATPTSFLTTIHMIISGARKLSLSSSLTPRKLYRGLREGTLPSCFSAAGRRSGTGGTVLGFTSATSKMAVAQRRVDTDAKDWPTIFEIETGQLEHGASLQGLSQYPAEEEVLLAPLCSFRVTGDARMVWHDGGGCWVVPMRCEVGARSRTREEHEARRKEEALRTAGTLLQETKRALLEALQSEDKSNLHDGAPLYESLLREWAGLLEQLRGQEAAWFDNDSNLALALADLVSARSYAAETMRAFTQDPTGLPASYFAQYSMTMWHRLRMGDAREAYTAAVQADDAAARQGAAIRVTFLEGHLVLGDVDRRSGLDGETAVMRAAVAGDEALLGLLADARCDVNATSARHCTALLAAVAAGQDRAVQKLLELGADPDKGKEDSGETPLHQAAEHHRGRCQQLLIAGGADVHRRSRDTTGNINSSLHVAAIEGVLESVQRLVEAGADVHAVDNGGKQPLHFAAWYGHLDCLRFLAEAGANLHAADSNGAQPIHLAAEHGQTECTRWLASVAGADVQAEDKDGLKPIHTAARHGHGECAACLVEVGADVHAVNHEGLQAIHLAAEYGHSECAASLRDAGAEVCAVDEDGRQPLHLAVEYGEVECARWLIGAGADWQAEDKNGDQPLHTAAMHGQEECMALLVEAGARVDASNKYGAQPIHLAAVSDDAACTRWLLTHGVHVRAVNKVGNQPIHLAARSGSVQCAQELKEAGADVHAVNASGLQPIHFAAWKGHLECARWLVDVGASVLAADKNGKQPFHLAAGSGHAQVAEWLKEASRREAAGEFRV